MAYALGKKDPVESAVKSRLSLIDHATVAKPPVSANWYTGDTDVDPLGNDDVGDCTCADEGHMANQVNWLLGNGAVATSDDCLSMYRSISAYDGTTATDEGALITDALDYMLAVGLAGVKIDAHAAINWQNTNLLQWGIADFLGVHLGLQVPESVFDQTDNNQVWVPVRGAQIAGGHDVYLRGYNSQTGLYYGISWGKPIAMSAKFVQQYADEAHVSAVSAVLKAPALSKYSAAALDAQWDTVTGSLQLPFERPIN